MKVNDIDLEDLKRLVGRPGKFEGETIATAYYRTASVEYGDGEHLWSDENSGESYESFMVDAEEAEAFDLPIGAFVVLHESSNGFVSLLGPFVCRREELEERAGVEPAIYEKAFDSGTEGMQFLSSGLCGSCEECASELGYFHDIQQEDEESDDAYNSRIMKGFSRAVELGCTHDEGGFSWHDCGICGDTKGGDRYIYHYRDEDGNIIHESDACPDCVERME